MARFNRTSSRSTMKVIGGSSHPGSLLSVDTVLTIFNNILVRTDRADSEEGWGETLQGLAGEVCQQRDERAAAGPGAVSGCLHHTDW